MSASPETDRDEQILDAEEQAAAAEAAKIGGTVPDDGEDPAHRPLSEAGEGESEGFELAEKALEDNAAHGDEHRFPDRDATPAEDREEAARGEADQTVPADG